MRTRTITIISTLIANVAFAQFVYKPMPAPPPAPQFTHDFPKVSSSALAFADVNSDGYPDVIISGGIGEDIDNERTALYLNDGQANGYTRQPDSMFFPVLGGSVDFADIDGDSDLDVLIVGTLNNPYSILYKNDGAGIFTKFDDKTLKKVSGVDADFADIDNDGDMDLIITGNYNPQKHTVLYTNDGAGNYTEVNNTGLTQAGQGVVKFADVDGDNDEDVG